MMRRRRFFTALGFPLLALILLQSGCRWEKGEPLPTLASNTGGYREDELALLRLAADDILTLERQRAYGKIYDQMGGRSFKQAVPRRDFLRMANCTENVMGMFIDYERGPLSFIRTEKDGVVYDAITRKILRNRGHLEENLVFIREGVEYKVHGLYWKTDRQDFNACIQEVMAHPTLPEKQPAPQPPVVVEKKPEAPPPEAVAAEKPAPPSNPAPPAPSTSSPAEATPKAAEKQMPPRPPVAPGAPPVPVKPPLPKGTEPLQPTASPAKPWSKPVEKPLPTDATRPKPAEVPQKPLTTPPATPPVKPVPAQQPIKPLPSQPVSQPGPTILNQQEPVAEPAKGR